KAQKNQPTTTGQPAIPTKNTQKQKTGIKNKQTHYRVHKQHPHTPDNQATKPSHQSSEPPPQTHKQARGDR
ncbi:MAG: hypothetical protein ACFN4K_05670, partial [Pauljensenia sp.]